MINILFSIPKKTNSVTFSRRPFIIIGVVLFVALSMRLYQWVRGPVVPTADVEPVGYEQIAATDSKMDGTDEKIDANDSEANGEIDVTNREAPAIVESEIPHAINLAVPFISQAPLGIWDEFTEETCEEASFFMVREYYAGVREGSIEPATADADFRAMALLQESMGFDVSISTSQFLSFVEAYGNTVGRVVEDPSTEDLRRLLAAGHPVIIPAFGRKLGNPFFTGEGPLYHMLVLRGYTPTTFIVNDPGTRHGENYQYATDVLMNSIGDWDGDSPDGGKRVIVLDP
jgi:hypothetical protein